LPSRKEPSVLPRQVIVVVMRTAGYALEQVKAMRKAV
jgi:hypothetical protein